MDNDLKSGSKEKWNVGGNFECSNPDCQNIYTFELKHGVRWGPSRGLGRPCKFSKAPNLGK